MGRMKEALGAYPTSGGKAWLDVTERHRCPVCGARSWCQVARDGATVLCKHHPSGVARTNRDGVEYHVHHQGGPVPRWTPPPPVPTVVRAPLDVLDRAYRAVLATLRLDDGDRNALFRRGLDTGAIVAGQYRSLPVDGRARVARAVLDAVGDPDGVPGMVWRTEGGRGWWSLGGCPGLLVPVRDAEGRVVALLVRRREPRDGPKYLYLSSAKHGGPAAIATVHVPKWVRRGTSPLVVTEGVLKADIAAHLHPTPVVGLPGVGAGRLALDLVKQWGARDVALAFDADARTNPTVARAEQTLVTDLRAAGVRVAVWRWDPAHKGLDDLLAARPRGETHDEG